MIDSSTHSLIEGDLSASVGFHRSLAKAETYPCRT